jgi:hypothetical protein
VDGLAVSQTSLKASVDSLTASVEMANVDAAKRARDLTLENLIQAGKDQIQADQTKTETLLTEIIGKQNQVRRQLRITRYMCAPKQAESRM